VLEKVNEIGKIIASGTTIKILLIAQDFLWSITAEPQAQKFFWWT